MGLALLLLWRQDLGLILVGRAVPEALNPDREKASI